MASKPFFKSALEHFHPLRQYETALELASGNAAMQILARLVVLLPSADDELALLERHVKLISGEAGDRKCDAQTFRAAGAARDALDIIGRIAVSALGDAIQHALDFIETKQIGTRKRRNPRHAVKALRQATLRGPCGAPCGYMALADSGRKASRPAGHARPPHIAAACQLTELQRARQGALGFGG